MAVRGKLGGWILGGLLILTAALHLFQEIPCLVVRSHGIPRELLILPIEPPGGFTLQFLHSYDRGWVWEHYTLEPDRKIYLTGLTLQSFLNGQGFVDGPLTIENGLGRIRGIRRPMDPFSFFLGEIADHRLVLRDETYPLIRYAPSGEILEIRGEEKTRGKILWNRFMKKAQRSFRVDDRPKV